MDDYLTTDTELTSVANAIRAKGGTSGSLVYPTGFVNAIEAISTGTDVSDTTAVEGDVLAGKYFHKANGSKVQGTIATKSSSDLTASGKTVTVPAGYYASQATKDVATGSATTPATTITANPSISVNSSGLITATNSKTQSVTPTVSAGYVSSGTAGTITVSGSNTSQLSTQAAQTIHPSSVDQAIASGKYLTGTQTINGVTTTNLTAGNIKQGVTVKIGDSSDDDCVTSVTGTYEGSGGTDVSDTTATAADVRTGKYFYTANGTKTQGTIVSRTSSDVTTSVHNNGYYVSFPDGYYSLGSKRLADAGGGGTYVPEPYDQTINVAGKYCESNIIIQGVRTENLEASNIKQGVTVKVFSGQGAGQDHIISSVTGTYAPPPSGGNHIYEYSGDGYFNLDDTLSAAAIGAVEYTNLVPQATIYFYDGDALMGSVSAIVQDCYGTDGVLYMWGADMNWEPYDGAIVYGITDGYIDYLRLEDYSSMYEWLSNSNRSAKLVISEVTVPWQVI